MDASAEWYEEHGVPISSNAFHLTLSALPRLRTAVSTPGVTVADVACGTGAATIPLYQSLGDGGHLYAEDIDATYLRVLEKKVAELKGEQTVKRDITVRVGNAETLDAFEDGQLDVLVSVAGLPWVFEEREKRVRALAGEWVCVCVCVCVCIRCM
jgi:ubiquinone/menaquinone biosynthesis C-methylase UbiE